MSNSKTANLDPDGEQSWQIARRYANQLNPVPSMVSITVRSLWSYHENDQENNLAQLDSVCYSAARRVDKTEILKAPIYFAASALYPNEFEKLSEDDSSKALIKILKPGFFAALLGLVYFQKRLNKICQSEHWKTLSAELAQNMEIGYIIGSALPKLSTADGILLGGIRYVALATFLVRDAETYRRYRNGKKGKFDLEYERSHWGCDHAQIAYYLLQDLGYIKEIPDLANALRKLPKRLDDANEIVRKWYAALEWIDDLKSGHCPPTNELALKILDFQEDCIEQLRENTANVIQHGSTFKWMLRGRPKKEEASESA